MNPTEDVDGRTLEPTELILAKLYQGMIPLAEEVELVAAFDPYTLSWTLTDISAGLYYYRLTVANDQGESDMSNEVTKECK